MGFEKGHPIYHKYSKGHTPWNKGKSGLGYGVKGKMPSNPFPKNHGVMRKDYTVSEETRKKISDKMKQRIFTEEHRKNLSKSGKGRKMPSMENHWNWKGGASFIPYPLGWSKTFKEQIRYRDGYKCQSCGVSETELGQKVDVHHKDENKSNLTPENLVCLCRSCHIKLHRGTLQTTQTG